MKARDLLAAVVAVEPEPRVVTWTGFAVEGCAQNKPCMGSLKLPRDKRYAGECLLSARARCRGGPRGCDSCVTRIDGAQAEACEAGDLQWQI